MDRFRGGVQGMQTIPADEDAADDWAWDSSTGCRAGSQVSARADLGIRSRHKQKRLRPVSIVACGAWGRGGMPSTVGIGDPVLDMLVHVPESTLERLHAQPGGCIEVDMRGMERLLADEDMASVVQTCVVRRSGVRMFCELIASCRM